MPNLRAPVESQPHPNTQVLARFAELSRNLLTSGRQPIDSSVRTQVLRDALRRQGLIRGKDQVRWIDLSSHLLERHKHFDGFLSERHLATQRGGGLAWLPSVLSTRKSSHPVVNLLLIDALFDGLEDFFAQVDACERKPRTDPDKSADGQMQGSDDPEHLLRRDSTRRFWLDLHSSNPTLSTTQLRPRMKAEYAWLYRNDRDWLRANSRGISAVMREQPSPRVDWSRRDVDYAARLMTTGNALLKKRSGRPFTMTRLLKIVGPETTLRKHLHQLPKLGDAMLTLLSHSLQEYMLRRESRFAPG